MMTQGELHHRFGGFSQVFVVDGESSKVLQPREGSLDNPSFRKHLEFGRTFVRPEYNLHGPTESFRHPVSQRALISTVGKDFLQTRELVFHLLDSHRRTFTVMKISFMDGNGHGQSKCVNHNMFLTSFDLFVAVNPFARRVGVV